MPEISLSLKSPSIHYSYGDIYKLACWCSEKWNRRTEHTLALVAGLLTLCTMMVHANGEADAGLVYATLMAIRVAFGVEK